MNCGAGEGAEGGSGQIIQEAQTMDNNKQETRATCQGEHRTQITQITNITRVPLPPLLLVMGSGILHKDARALTYDE